MICERTLNKYVLDNILDDIYSYIKVPVEGKHIIRVHTKKLDVSGDLSFPLYIKNLYNLISERICTREEAVQSTNIGEPGISKMKLIESEVEEASKNWSNQLNKVIVANDNLHIYLERDSIFKPTIWQCCHMEKNYGVLHRDSKIIVDLTVIEFPKKNADELSLANLRLLVLKEIIKNLTMFQSHGEGIERHLSITLTSKQKFNQNEVLCGYVTTDNGAILAETLYKKRSTDMRLMAEHKYGLRIKSSQSRNEYFEKLGKAGVTLELLQNKPRKNIKIAFHNPSSANKDASFILYNCARLSALLRDFNEKVNNKMYPELVPVDNVDFSLLNQPEEWELFYVYIMQYPLLIKSCIKDIEKGIINPHYLVSFLCKLCSVFSVYYRRVRILGAPLRHLIPILHARIYFLNSLQQVFHKTLQLLNIDPIKSM